MKVETLFCGLLLTGASAVAENAYTNHAGNVVAGWPVKLTATHVTLSESAMSTARWGHRALPTAVNQPSANCQLTTNGYNLSTLQLYNFSTTNTYPLSIFPESERRRIAADFGEPRVPAAVKRAITGAEKAMARSRKRAEKGLCAKEESDAFCAKTEAALKRYLDRQVESGAISPAERKALGRVP